MEMKDTMKTIFAIVFLVFATGNFYEAIECRASGDTVIMAEGLYYEMSGWGSVIMGYLICLSGNEKG